MKPKFIVFAAVCALGPCAHADKAPLVLETPPATSPGEAPIQKFSLSMTPFRTFFAMLKVSSGCNFIVADDVQGLIHGTVSGRTTDEIVQNFCTRTNLAWGKAGANTYLIVRQTPVVKIETVEPPPSERLPRKDNDFVIGRIPGLTDKAQSDRPESWRPFDFNGQKMFLVPTAPKTGSE